MESVKLPGKKMTKLQFWIGNKLHILYTQAKNLVDSILLFEQTCGHAPFKAMIIRNGKRLVFADPSQGKEALHD